MINQWSNEFSAANAWFRLSPKRTVARAFVFSCLLAWLTQPTTFAEDSDRSSAVPRHEVATDNISTDQCADKATRPASGENLILVPGSGFSGETEQPESRGSGKGSEEKAIARWDVVPFQVFDKTMNVGVIAFHVNEIEKVSFSVEGGPWKDVHSMKLNSETDVVEYWVTLRASDFGDGPVEVRAIAYPTAGVPRVLQGSFPFNEKSKKQVENGEHSMWLFANSGEKLKNTEFFVSPSLGNDANDGSAANPVKSLARALTLASKQDGDSIVLTEAGEYFPDRTAEGESKNTRWITVKPREGLAREDVKVVGKSQALRIFTRIMRLRWQGLTFRPDTYAYMNELSATQEHLEWYDHCHFTTPARQIDEALPYRSTVYMTNCRFDSFIYGPCGAIIVRNCAVKDVLDAFQNSPLVINGVVERSRPSLEDGTTHHPDLYQTFGDRKNIIVYGMKGEDISGMQILFINQPLGEAANMTDAAFVDFDVKTYDKKGGPPYSQLQGPLNHILFKNVKIANQLLLWRTDLKDTNGFVARNVVFEDCYFYNRLNSRTMLPRGVTVRGSKKKITKAIEGQ